jgi:hypothetical protein
MPPQQGDFIQNKGTLKADGSFENLITARQVSPIMPSILTSEPARQRVKDAQARLRTLTGLYYPPKTDIKEPTTATPETKSVPSDALTIDELQALNGGDLSNFDFDQVNNVFIPKSNAIVDMDRVKKNRRFQATIVGVNNDLNRLMLRSDIGVQPIYQSMLDLINVRKDILGNLS